ncbi:DUF2011 domain-containing protein [Aspergillus foveolatus]|uniref:DUF2011 domain-containing protein n=1 Tax=Aspergillus foveolatus TaxID=210207 RepID=UPI003CCD54C1
MMFDLPDAKRVRRDDLLTRTSSSPSPSPPPESLIPDAQKRLSALLDFDFNIAPASEPETQGTKDNEPEEQEFEFRLFSSAPAPRTSSTAQKGSGDSTTTVAAQSAQKLRIRLRSPTPTALGSKDGGFVNPFRGWSYYFSTPDLLTGAGAKGDEDAGVALKRKQFEDVAVSGEDMVKMSGVPWPGCHLPWRVIRLKREHTKLPKEEKGTSKAAPATTYIVDVPERVPLSRKKPGKKRRIQLRKKAAAAERAKETEAEKRNRRNREKKIKRRQKAREAKAAAAAAGGGDGAGSIAAMEANACASGQESD